MSPMQVIIGAFAELRARGVVDPLYSRLVLRRSEGDGAKGWLWRDQSKVGRPLQTGETFVLTVIRQQPGRKNRTADVRITWTNGLWASVSGTDADCKLVLWFLHQQPRVSGGTHQSIDSFKHGAADWRLATGDFFLVRCGHYRNGEKILVPRQASDDAIAWVNDPARFLVPDFIRQRVLTAMEKPMPNGEYLTIRRVFSRSAECS